MAIGDEAAAAGIPLTPGTAQANTLETIINQVKDYIGRLMLNLPRKITVSATQPTNPQEGDVWIKVT